MNFDSDGKISIADLLKEYEKFYDYDKITVYNL